MEKHRVIHNPSCQEREECSPTCAIKSLEIDPNCAICFNFMVEPVRFPGTDNDANCQHAFCKDCTKDLFREDKVTARFTGVITRKCPYCRATGRIYKDKHCELDAQESETFKKMKID